MCVDLALRPSPLVLLALVAIVILAVSRVIRAGGDEARAVRTLNRAAVAVAVAVVAAGSVLIAQVWFALIPLGGIDGTYFWPFPFGLVEMTTTPLTGS